MALPRILYYDYILNKNLQKSREEILRLREKKFKRLLNYAYYHSPFYRDYYSAAGIREKDLLDLQIKDLPVIDKGIMMDNFEQIVVDKDITRKKVENFLEKNPSPESVLDDEYHVIHSSGSSGQIGYYLYSRKEWDFVKAIALRLFPHFGLKKKNYAFIGAADGHYAGISLFLSPVGSLEEYFYNKYLIIDINRPIKRYRRDLNLCQPDNLTGYPSGVKILAEMQRKGEIDISPQVIVCGGEPLSEKDRDYIKETWDVDLVNYYAASESLMIGVRREEFNDLYIFDDANYLEFKENYYLLTNLCNYTLPLIRYRMNDLLIPDKREDIINGQIDHQTGKAVASWPFTRVKEIIGRRELTLYFKNEADQREFIHPIVFVEFYVKGLKKFQIIQENEVSFTFKAVIEESNREQVINRIRARLKEILCGKNLQNVSFNIELVEDIPVEESTGKFRLIKSNL